MPSPAMPKPASGKEQRSPGSQSTYGGRLLSEAAPRVGVCGDGVPGSPVGPLGWARWGRAAGKFLGAETALPSWLGFFTPTTGLFFEGGIGVFFVFNDIFASQTCTSERGWLRLFLHLLDLNRAEKQTSLQPLPV